MTREEIIAMAKLAHDKRCHCSAKYPMSCNTMMQEILNVNHRPVLVVDMSIRKTDAN